jgi:thiosulfate/3-mercaptopyruvate sulfurtransferase
MHTTLISAPALQSLVQGSSPCMVFDCSFDLGQSAAGQQQHVQARIPGAIRADLDQHLSQHTDLGSAASGGRHPLPSREAFAQWLNTVGFRNDMQAVVYDRQGAQYCGRLWWMLKWCGHEAVAVLDGGWPAWLAAGGSVQSGPVSTAGSSTTAPGFELRDPCAGLVDTSQIVRQLGAPSLTVLDARAAARFRGEVEPLDPVAGHIPGALNRPFNANFETDGRFKPAAQLRIEFEQVLAGRDPATVVHHCGSGVTAVPNLLAMEIAGLGRARLYAGSWSEWSNTPGLPCARG